MKKFEYLVTTNSDNNKMDELGANGWELVSATPVQTREWTARGYVVTDELESGSNFVCVFKRELE